MSELPSLTKKEMDEMRDLLGNGSPEWLALYAAVRNHGTVTNENLKREVGTDPTWNLSYARMSQAKKRLVDRGLLRGVQTYRGATHNFEMGMDDAFTRLFQAALEIIRRRNENAYYRAGNRMKKKKAD